VSNLKVGFVNIFGKPNAGKSTFLNAIMQQKLAIVSHKVQTTRHRIKGIFSDEESQIIFSDTPGIIDPKYKLHQKMMMQVKNSLEDGDIALLMLDITDRWDECQAIFDALNIDATTILILNKIDKASPEKIQEAIEHFQSKNIYNAVIPISALKNQGTDILLQTIKSYLPTGHPYYDADDVSDLPTKFFVSELVRENIYKLYSDELPYHTAVVIQEYKEKLTLTKIRADIVVQRESQKMIILGQGGMLIKQLGSMARVQIEEFIQRKVFLELFVKVKPNWRDNDMYLKEYGY
jgi:GTPase